jgi:hypothetical protein
MHEEEEVTELPLGRKKEEYVKAEYAVYSVKSEHEKWWMMKSEYSAAWWKMKLEYAVNP